MPNWIITRTNGWYQILHKDRVMATALTSIEAHDKMVALSDLYGDNLPLPATAHKRGQYAYTLKDGTEGVLHAAKTLAEARNDLRYRFGCKRLPNGTNVFRLERE